MQTTASPTVLLLNGSPRKENSTTLTLAEAFAKGYCKAVNGKLTVYHLAELRIKPCTGCLSCWSRTEGTCVIRDDDVPMLKERILQSDLIMECFPLYFFSMPGQAKLFTDRMLSMLKTYAGQKAPADGGSVHGFRYERPEKKFVLFSGCAHTETMDVFDSLRKQFDLICGENGYTSVFVPQVMTLVEMGGARLARVLDRFQQAGAEFAEAGQLSAQTLSGLERSPFSEGVYRTLLDNVWKNRKAGTVPCK